MYNVVITSAACVIVSQAGESGAIMSDSSDEEDIPDLVPADIKRVPVTVITGFLGEALNMLEDHSRELLQQR